MKIAKDVSEFIDHCDNEMPIGFSLSMGSGGTFHESTDIQIKKIKKIKDQFGRDEFIVTGDDDLEYDFYAIVIT